jgi:hypothetical protein
MVGMTRAQMTPIKPRIRLSANPYWRSLWICFVGTDLLSAQWPMGTGDTPLAAYENWYIRRTRNPQGSLST